MRKKQTDNEGAPAAATTKVPRARATKKDDAVEGTKAPARRKQTKKPASEPIPAASTPSAPIGTAGSAKPTSPEPEKTARMIAEKRETPIQTPMPKSVREPVQPLPARPPESRPAALVNAPESTS